MVGGAQVRRSLGALLKEAEGELIARCRLVAMSTTTPAKTALDPTGMLDSGVIIN
jgi:hypothetical protein